MSKGANPARSWLCPEVIQSSAMDCGPACLKSLAAGFAVEAHYGRLREACQTDVDGTSIDVLEAVAGDLGLDAEQIVVPLDHLLEPGARALPAIVVVRLPSGANHFVVVWRKLGAYLQLMDPAKGRRWVRARDFLKQVYIHQAAFPIADWSNWTRGAEFVTAFQSRLRRIGIADRIATERIERAHRSNEGRSVAALDAAVRMTNSIVEAGGVARGAEAGRLLDQLMSDHAIPPGFWAMRPSVGNGQVAFRGVVVLRVRGRSAARRNRLDCPELQAAITGKEPGSASAIWALVREEVAQRPGVLVLAALFASIALLTQGLLLRAALELSSALGLGPQRWAAVAALLGFLIVSLALDVSIARGVLQMGRNLEARFRIRFWKKIPRLSDRYFQSRLVSDMADRGHNVHHLASLPLLASELLRTGMILLLTTAGIVWLDPTTLPLALSAAASAVAIPLLFLPATQERDLRVRSHSGALSRFYLDALLGIVCLRVHSAAPALEREHEKLLVEWSHAGVALHRLSVGALGLQMTFGFGIAAWLLASQRSTSPSGSALLLVYWVLCLPALGENLAQLCRQVPRVRSLALRLMEPLGAAEESRSAMERSAGAVDRAQPRPAEPGRSRPAAGMELALKEVDVVASGHRLLEGIDLRIEPGMHVAVVGPSGAGKSTLVGLLLGWHRAAQGTIHVDGEILDGDGLERLRAATAWVDPTVQIWNRSLLENLLYGADPTAPSSIPEILDDADLKQIAARLPQGLSSRLGEGGAKLSGGEGQRVRLGRALMRADARLVVLDEAFRGLDRVLRGKLLSVARRRWNDSTLICVTHDVDHTLDFDRVLVLEGGRIVEDGSPRQLAAAAGSRYACVLRAAENIRHEIWENRFNRRLRIVDGVVSEQVEPATHRDVAR